MLNESKHFASGSCNHRRPTRRSIQLQSGPDCVKATETRALSRLAVIGRCVRACAHLSVLSRSVPSLRRATDHLTVLCDRVFNRHAGPHHISLSRPKKHRESSTRLCGFMKLVDCWCDYPNDRLNVSATIKNSDSGKTAMSLCKAMQCSNLGVW